MALKWKLSRLEQIARGTLRWIDLPDGSSYYYDAEQIHAELFLFAANSIRALHRGEPSEAPEPPNVLRVIGGLATPEDRERAFWEVYGTTTHPFVSYDLERFFATGEIVAADLAARGPDRGDEPLDEGIEVREGLPPN